MCAQLQVSEKVLPSQVEVAAYPIARFGTDWRSVLGRRCQLWHKHGFQALFSLVMPVAADVLDQNAVQPIGLIGGLDYRCKENPVSLSVS